jgi:hypothetical protein
MVVKPNLVVGAVGVVIVLITGLVVVNDWESLTGIKRFRVDVAESAGGWDGSGEAPVNGNSFMGQFTVSERNVTMVSGHLQWSGPNSRPTVTLRLYYPNGTLAFEQSSAAGAEGIAFALATSDVPTSKSYRTKEGPARDQYAADYPGYDGGTGVWKFEVTARAPPATIPVTGPGSVFWTLRSNWQSYTTTLQELAPTDFSRK